MFHRTLLIRKIPRNQGWKKRYFLLSSYVIVGRTSDRVLYLIRSHKGENKGFGTDATLERTEKAFVKFLLANYGVGEYTVAIHRGRRGLKVFWRGIIEQDRFYRIKGSMAPYIYSVKPTKAWHDIFTKKVVVPEEFYIEDNPFEIKGVPVAEDDEN